MKKAIQIDERDNVASVTSEVDQGEKVQIISSEGDVVMEMKVVNATYFAHKIALQDVNKGEKVIKYGETIGFASKPIKLGEWVHIHNVESASVPTSAHWKDVQ